VSGPDGLGLSRYGTVGMAGWPGLQAAPVLGRGAGLYGTAPNAKTRLG
jgi:hypothetical protein